MSLILEALKKSEQQRRLGEAPTLGTPVLAVRGRRSLLPLFGALIAIALVAGWWLSRPAPPVSAARTATADATAQPANASAPAPPMNRIKPTLNHAAPARQATAAKREPAPPKPMPSSGLEAVAAPTPIAPSTTDRPGSVAQLAPVLLPAPLPPPANAAAEKRATAPAPAKPLTSAPVAPTKPSAAARPSAPASAAPALPSVWDLPYATRKDLPDLALTMHVYADDPHERFVVIKGERHGEGDDLGDGVTLREIRPDGMVLEFKGTRFVYPRDGR
jgi:general secretion pathway protein B